MDLKEVLNEKAKSSSNRADNQCGVLYNQNTMFQQNMARKSNQAKDTTLKNNNLQNTDLGYNQVSENNIQNNSSSEQLPQPNQPEVIMNNVPQFEITINEAKDRILQLQEFIRFMMVPNIDYGFIPNCPKPTLFKAGAEKLCDVYGFTRQIEVINRIEDFDKGLFHYEVKATLTNKRTGLVEAEGIGCCNNKEKKYVGQDPFSILNTILKMAKKRALVDAVLSATRTSGIFSQDLENQSNVN